MPILYQWNDNIDKLNTFSWLISPEVVQMVLLLKKTKISWNRRYFRLRLFLIFEHSVNCSMSLHNITVTSQECHSFGTQRRFDWLITSLFSIRTRVPISYSWVNRLDSLPVQQVIWITYMKESCSLSRPYDLAIDSISFGWLIVNVLCHPDDIRSMPKSPGWQKVSWTLCHSDEIAPGRISSGWRMTNAEYHPDDLRCCPISSGWDN